MKLTNWLGQDIEAGTYVYRGAREGNSSSYKIGQVRRVNLQSGKATVDWAAEAPFRDKTYVFINQRRVDIDVPGIWDSSPRAGTCSVDTLVVVTKRDYDYARARALAAKNAEQAVKQEIIAPEDAGKHFERELERLVGELVGI